MQEDAVEIAFSVKNKRNPRNPQNQKGEIASRHTSVNQQYLHLAQINLLFSASPYIRTIEQLLQLLIINIIVSQSCRCEDAIWVPRMCMHVRSRTTLPRGGEPATPP
jgi:hypothetical protein